VPALPFLLGFVPGATALLATHWSSYGSWAWLTAVAGYVFVPIVDLFVGEDSYNATQEEENRLKRNPWFRVVMWLYTPSYIATILYGAYVISNNPDLTFWQLAGIHVSVGIAGGFGIGCVHEMIHRPSAIELSCGIVACVFANYSHFWIEHLWGHHKRVATDEDPASSNLGDDVYTFLVRVIWKSFWDAIDLERRFVANRKGSIFSNRILIGYTCSAIIAYSIYHYFGLYALYFYIGQGVITALHIENANYIEHYGLRRRKVEGKFDKDGEPVYERPGWFHAWDTADRFSNWILFKIQRHPDHHTNAGRAYQILRTLPQSPHMPTGYAGMFVLSWFPPLFWAVMDPLVENAYRQREKMEALGIAASAFPKGSNNISSFFKREGEGYFEPGSSPYQDDESFYGGSDVSKPKHVWQGVDYDENFEKLGKQAPVVESGKITKFAKNAKKSQ
jgi:alkane 1-monooxygenase